MSDTPLCDAWRVVGTYGHEARLLLGLARRMERERNEARDVVKDLMLYAHICADGGVSNSDDQLEAEADAAIEKARTLLEKLETQ